MKETTKLMVASKISVIKKHWLKQRLTESYRGAQEHVPMVRSFSRAILKDEESPKPQRSLP